MASTAAKDAERVRQDKRQFVKAASTLQIRDESSKSKPVDYYKKLALHMVGEYVGVYMCVFSRVVDTQNILS
jgi:hypothetical protein